MADHSRRRERNFRKHYYVDVQGCWKWTGCKDSYGYGICGRNTKAHRYSYSLHNGKIPKDLCVCHRCDNRDCVNPDHLFLGSSKENRYDAISKNRHSYGENHGPAKLKEKDVLKILARRKRGESGVKIASEYGVTSGLIYAITKRRIWKHVQLGEESSKLKRKYERQNQKTAH